MHRLRRKKGGEVAGVLSHMPLERECHRLAVVHCLDAICRRFKPGTKALMEIRKLQRGGNLLIPNLPFQRVVREVCAEYTTEPFRFTAEALLALQEASEDMMVWNF